MTCSGRDAVILHALVVTQFSDMPGRHTVYNMPWLGCSYQTCYGQDIFIWDALAGTHFDNMPWLAQGVSFDWIRWLMCCSCCGVPFLNPCCVLYGVCIMQCIFRHCHVNLELSYHLAGSSVRFTMHKQTEPLISFATRYIIWLLQRSWMVLHLSESAFLTSANF